MLTRIDTGNMFATKYTLIFCYKIIEVLLLGMKNIVTSN